MAPSLKPPSQRIASEMAVHHEMGPTRRRQAVEPVAEHLIQGGLADPHRRIAEDPVEPGLGVHGVGPGHSHVGSAVGGRIARREAQGPLVHVHCDHLSLGGAERDRAGHWSPAAAQVEHAALVGGQRGRLEQQQPGARVETAGREDPGVGDEAQVPAVDVDVERPWSGGRTGPRLEVVPR